MGQAGLAADGQYLAQSGRGLLAFGIEHIGLLQGFEGFLEAAALGVNLGLAESLLRLLNVDRRDFLRIGQGLGGQRMGLSPAGALNELDQRRVGLDLERLDRSALAGRRRWRRWVVVRF